MLTSAHITFALPPPYLHPDTRSDMDNIVDFLSWTKPVQHPNKRASHKVLFCRIRNLLSFNDTARTLAFMQHDAQNTDDCADTLLCARYHLPYMQCVSSAPHPALPPRQ